MYETTNPLSLAAQRGTAASCIGLPPAAEAFHAYHAGLLARHLGRVPARMLCLGSGIAQGLGHLAEQFPDTALYTTANTGIGFQYPGETGGRLHVIPDKSLADHRFDLIVAINGLSAIPHCHGAGLIRRLGRLLVPGGNLWIVQPNPYSFREAGVPGEAENNPLARQTMVALLETAGLRVRRQGYGLFFPPGWKSLSRLEPALAWLPVGACYFVLGGW